MWIVSDLCGRPKEFPRSRKTKNVCSSPCKDRRGNESEMGEEKGRNSCCKDCKEKGRNYFCGTKKAFTADEGAVGGKKESPEEVNAVKRTELASALITRHDE
jgi:hypothetical protein